VPYVGMAVTNCHFGYPRCKAKKHLRSIDPHVQNGAVTVLLTIFPIQAANISVVHSSNYITGQLWYLQDPKSLTLR